jgi:hypothetical protein
MRTAITSLLMALLPAAAACSPSASAQQDLESNEQGSLTGVWSASFHLEKALLLSPPPTASEVIGQIALMNSPWIEKTYSSEPEPRVLEGIYDIDFSPFRFESRVPREVPLAMAKHLGNDSVEVRLNPHVGHGGVVLRGVRSADSVHGIWYYESSKGGQGYFVLKLSR